MGKKLVLIATSRYSINMNDFYMFFRRSDHCIIAILYHFSVGHKSWWLHNRFSDPARNRIYDKLRFTDYRFLPWYDAGDLCEQLDHLEFDYVCMGNGSGTDQQMVVEHVGLEKCLFSEYGWLPWNENFYISRDGCGHQSDIARMTAADLQSQPINMRLIERLQNKFKGGRALRERDFVYVPLQKDINDFKFKSSPFQHNEEFLDFIHEIVPNGMKVYIKQHPLYPKEYDFKKYGTFVDISTANYEKKKIYSQMSAMVCINSTSILEAILFGGKVFAYGDDIFCNKDLVEFRVFDRDDFESGLQQHPSEERCLQFISLLLERQIHRKRCIRNDRKYIENHFWNCYL